MKAGGYGEVIMISELMDAFTIAVYVLAVVAVDVAVVVVVIDVVVVVVAIFVRDND